MEGANQSIEARPVRRAFSLVPCENHFSNIIPTPCENICVWFANHCPVKLTLMRCITGLQLLPAVFISNSYMPGGSR